MKWRVASASARGSSHLRTGQPNQDACEQITTAEGPVKAMLAVSDGHGSARHFRSQIGSQLAAHVAITVVPDFVASQMEANPAAPLRNEALSLLARTLVDGWRSAVQSDLAQNPIAASEWETLAAAEGDGARLAVEQDPILAYGATLLVAAVTDSFLLFLQLGDGDILTVNAAGETTRPLPSDERLVGNQTTSLCQPEAWKQFRGVCAQDGANRPALILVSTDGYANSFRSEDDFLKIGGDYLNLVREEGLDALSEDLPTILAEASQEGSGDDITLGILLGDISYDAPVALPDGATPAMKATPAANVIMPGGVTAAAGLPLRRWRLSAQQARVIAVVVVIIAGGLFAQYFGKGISLSRKPDARRPAVGDKEPAAAPASGGPAAQGNVQWVLEMGSGRSFPLKPGEKITAGTLLQLKKDNPDRKKIYAEVAKGANGVLELINHSDDPWTVQLPNATEPQPPVGKEDKVPLANGVTVTFRSGVSATISVER
jgi:hypothetical protein